ncbi:hypothetical protein LOTGIDRAFT_166285 [Lottia gigantea]|uniref:Uncharacterized protein n=1 Tax=Lottia gigantea TaxID=225164 RepID=V3ZTJ4_LOTGI|nr:hypothetical protein LOTGIDRAFT_166285 [Lottia gigantea]ESO87702.1 hypothetical protein LOTGIDRAFT_166285 [Lottia gigantea]
MSFAYGIKSFVSFFCQPKYAKKKIEVSLHKLSIWNRNYRIKSKMCLSEIQQPIEKPVTSGKEKVINLPKKLPLKRPRSDDSIDIPRNEDLADIYDESPAKKLCTEEVTSRIENDQSDLDDFESENKCTSHIKSKSHSPSKKLTAADVCNISMEDDTSEKSDTDKENEIKPKISPHRNRFAVSSGNQKHKFNLNEKKNVVIKSRFFAKNEIKSEPESLSSELGNSTVIPANIKSEPNESKDTDKTTPVLPKLFSPEKLKFPTNKPIKTNSKSSKKTNLKKSNSLSAFSWSKFKFTKNSNADTETSKSVNSAFQSVIKQEDRDSGLNENSKTNQELENSASNTEFSLADQSETSLKESQSSLCSLISLEGSSKSNICSLDTECLPSTQDLEEFDFEQKKTMKTESDFELISTVSETKRELVVDNNSNTKSTSISTFFKSNSSSSLDATNSGLKKRKFDVYGSMSTESGLKKANSGSNLFGGDSSSRTDSDSDKFNSVLKKSDSSSSIIKSSYFSKGIDNSNPILIDDNSNEATTTQNQVVKKECRVSGLTKTSRKKSGSTSKVLDINQTKIKDLFFKVGRKPSRLEEVSEFGMEMTPESINSTKASKLSSTVQRKLLS